MREDAALDALIAMLLVKYLQLRSTFGWSLSNLVALLRQPIICLPGPVDLDQRTLFQPPPISASLPKTVGAAVGLSRPIGTCSDHPHRKKTSNYETSKGGILDSIESGTNLRNRHLLSI